MQGIAAKSLLLSKNTCIYPIFYVPLQSNAILYFLGSIIIHTVVIFYLLERDIVNIVDFN